MADYFDYYLSTYDDPDEPKQRYLVDVKSEAHQVCRNHNLTYIEGVIYNDICYVTSNMGEYLDDDHWTFLHFSEVEFELAVSSLVKKGLIDRSNGRLTPKKLTYDQLLEDQTMKDLGLSDLMEAFKTMMLEVNNG